VWLNLSVKSRAESGKSQGMLFLQLCGNPVVASYQHLYLVWDIVVVHGMFNYLVWNRSMGEGKV